MNEEEKIQDSRRVCKTNPYAILRTPSPTGQPYAPGSFIPLPLSPFCPPPPPPGAAHSTRLPAPPHSSTGICMGAKRFMDGRRWCGSWWWHQSPRKRPRLGPPLPPPVKGLQDSHYPRPSSPRAWTRISPGSRRYTGIHKILERRRLRQRLDPLSRALLFHPSALIPFTPRRSII